MGRPVTVAIVDDDAIVRAALVAYLTSAEGFEVRHELTNGAEAVSVITRDPVDVVVMDVRMPKLDGIQATQALRSTVPNIKILVITSFDEDGAVRDALSAGANGFLLKDTSPTGLVDAIRAVMQGTSVVSPGPITSLLLQDKRRARPVPAPELGLSPRELQILRLLCAAYSNTEIAEELFVSESTVKTHVSAIMTKMQVPSRLKAVVRAYELGLVEHS
ncbi:response regulator transcription factor [Propioniciclava sp. MC1683]|uniref:response regulator n=1 Tax=Propioniciclava sp. MC1683 TaxID=2760309 RepID=UPI001603F607|nr:response regulator transcription factor [Propioniciclava sp. MC1683]MBB1500343.1 response regulator transcription factor [Propioniciclava sp. MC1683]